VIPKSEKKQKTSLSTATFPRTEMQLQTAQEDDDDEE
jgi:hypothetical protein